MAFNPRIKANAPVNRFSSFSGGKSGIFEFGGSNLSFKEDFSSKKVKDRQIWSVDKLAQADEYLNKQVMTELIRFHRNFDFQLNLNFGEFSRAMKKSFAHPAIIWNKFDTSLDLSTSFQ